MSIENLDFNSIYEKDIQSLYDNGVPEGLYHEYKLEIYGNSDKDKKELLKDISSFANSFGGHLFIGVEEKKRYTPIY